MTLIGLIPACAIVLAMLADGRYVIYFFVPSCLLMASAAVFLAGQGITPAHLMLVGLFLCCSRQRATLAFLKPLLFKTLPGLALLTLALYGVTAAFFYPRIFEGATYVNMFASEVPNAFLNPPPLGPSSANVTQSIYMVGSFFTFFAIIIICTDAGRYHHLYKAFVATVIMNIAFAFIDLATYYSGTSFLLDVVHNGNYVIRTGETAVLGLKRISGSFTETSAFSATTLGLFGFTLRLWLRQMKTWPMLVLTLSQAGLLILSTSSTGLGGLVVVLLVSWLISALRLIQAKAKLAEAWFVFLFPVLVTSISLAALAFDPLREVSGAVIQSVFFDKAQNESGVERLMLNAQAMTNFFDSHGLGLGFGSVRASSFALALLASVGIPGAICFVIFFGSLCISRTSSTSDEAELAIQDGCRMASFALLTAACISATSMDLNLLFFAFAAGAYWPQTRRLRAISYGAGDAIPARLRSSTAERFSGTRDLSWVTMSPNGGS